MLFFSPGSQAGDLSIDQKINQLLTPIANFFTNIIFYSIEIGEVQLPLVVAWLIIAATIFTFYFGFINIRGFTHACRIVKGEFSDPDDPGEVTHFQALTTALSGTLGLGNIAGVAIAISIGGPGATFWMIVAGFFGMSTKFIECTLGLKYRYIDASGIVHGGPMYYLQNGLGKLGFKKLGMFLAKYFAICCAISMFCGGNMLQSNQAYKQFVNAFGDSAAIFADKGWLFGMALAVIVALVILGGIKSIVKFTEKVIPFMAGLYVLAAVFVLASHYDKIPNAIILIIENAFAPIGVLGGFIGVMIQGFKRSAFSNEAGVGIASIAHSTATTKEPIREGYVALLEPFIDTIVICTITALVIVITGAYQTVDGIDGVTLTSNAFASVIWWFPYVLSICVILFAISTMVASAYYGSIAISFLTGNSTKADLLFKMVFLSFAIIGASSSLDAVIAISDSLFFSMAIANIIGLYLLAPEVRRDLKTYQKTYCTR